MTTRGPNASSTWAVLDAALVRRAEGAAAQARAGGTDLATTLLVAEAAAAALLADGADREQAESDLSGVLDLVGLPDADADGARAAAARRLHNAAVLRLRRARGRRRSAGALPATFEMAERAGTRP